MKLELLIIHRILQNITPIEHKLFSHVSRTIKGCILDTIGKVKEVIEKTEKRFKSNGQYCE